MRVLKRIVVALLGLLALLALVGLALPSAWRVERSVTVAAGPEAILPLLDAPRQWPVWSAWNRTRYPDLVSSFEGPERGVGAAWTWRGESSGAGRLEITRSEATRGVEYRLAFEDFPPIAGRMALEPGAGATTIRWTMDGDVGANLAARYFVPFMDDWMIDELDLGLGRLKQLVESAPAPSVPSVAAPSTASATASAAETPAAGE